MFQFPGLPREINSYIDEYRLAQEEKDNRAVHKEQFKHIINYLNETSEYYWDFFNSLSMIDGHQCGETWYRCKYYVTFCRFFTHNKYLFI